MTYVPSGTTLRFADMNGNGSTDVVWIKPTGNGTNASCQMTYLELFQARPNLINRITTGAGKVIELTYGTSVRQMAAAKAAGKPWSYRLPNPMVTLDAIATYDTLSNLRQTRHFEYSDGYYDGTEKQFRGFEHVTVTTDGDTTVETTDQWIGTDDA